NYREYYYLPAEDMAVHKSVATYVDKDYRVQAKKENCYLRHTGHFISQINDGIMSGYRKDLKDKETFIELNDSFLQDMDMVNAYARHVISSVI
ncbi:MAG: elongation subunit of DNA-dependent DNA polymerase, partial [Lachnospiraceae bacterium]|nr:elongation subunit of DNA-dependent DNA polymerase [Lachnospiraceae bacterium]